MGRHTTSIPGGIPAIYLIHGRPPEPDTDVLPAVTDDPHRRPRVAPWIAGLALVGTVAASGVAVAPVIAADDQTAPLARVADLPDRGAVSQAVAVDRLADLAASRASRESEQAAAAQVQAVAETTAAQEAQEAADEEARKQEAATVSEAAQEPEGTPEQATETAPSGPAAEVAVQTAMAQLGAPYVWGAVGPSSFDCSGLVLFAYAAAGIDLPRVSSAQAQAGVAVSRDDLQPGDLVAYYSPVSHIGIYIGNGQIVHAPEPGDVVKVTDIDAFGSAPTAYRRVA